MLIKSVFAFFLGWPIYLGVRRAAAPGPGRGADGAAPPAADGAGSLGAVYLRSRRPAPSRSRLALRIAVLGGVAVALFAVLFFRLWNLQVLDGGKYLAEAKNNRTREYKVIAPRGDILDRDGERPGRQPDQPGAAARHRRSCPQTRPKRRPSWPSSASSPTCRCSKVRQDDRANRKKSPPGRR